MAHSADFQLNLSLFLAKHFLWGIDTSFCRGGGGAGIVFLFEKMLAFK